MEPQRIDKFLWAVRLFKTRSMATDACKKGRVSLNGEKAKPSRLVNVNDTIAIYRPPIEHTFKVKELIKNRVGAKLVPDYLTDLTPQSEYDKLEEIQMSKVDYYRPQGTGRPTKRDRRLLDQIWDE
ncbi:MAG: RNA-binding S4 domain-containing protein [Bacteroidales bacterium]|nr:RNA-binding S4 domain-containing protein [Bacteroidales bacterium]